MVEGIVHSYANGHLQAESFSSAFQGARTVISQGFFVNVEWALIALSLFIGSMIIQLIVGWIVWYTLMFLGSCCSGKKVKSLNNKEDSEDHPYHMPVNGQAAFSVLVEPPPMTSATYRGPKMITRYPPPNSVSGVHPSDFDNRQNYVNVDKPPIDPKDTWHGHKRSKYESFVRLTVILLRVIIVITGIALSFQVAGVNFFSLAISVGVIGMVFTYGAGGLISNVFAAIYMFTTDKIELHMWIAIGAYQGEVTAMRAQWIEIVNDYDARQGRRIIHIPNNMLMSSPLTVWDNGPPPIVIQSFKLSIVEVNKYKIK